MPPPPAAEQFSSIERQNSYVEQQQQPHKAGAQQQLMLVYNNNNNNCYKNGKVSGSGAEEKEEMVTFRYTWPVRITERLIGTGESAILNVSPAFCTAYNGVQFTWLLRICEEDILPPNIGDQSEEDNSVDSSYFASGGDDDELELTQQQQKKVNITLYYKEGPARDVKLCGGNIFIRNSEGILFDNMPLPDLEYTKGGGWSPISDEVLNNAGRLRDEQRKFSAFIHNNIGKQITVRVHMKMPASLFQPMQYLPSIESPLSGGKLEALCATVLDEIRQNQLQVPDVEHFDLKTDKYALYRHVFLFGCSEIFERSLKDPSNFGVGLDELELMEKIKNVFAHYYFNTIIVREAECFEDFLEALDASRHVQFPALRRECERFICTEVMAESADLTFVKKMLLLAERFNLSVLKMVSFGVIVDRLLLQETAPRPFKRLHGNKTGLSKHKDGSTIDSMEEIREELLEIAEQIIHPTEHLHNIQCSSPSSVSASSMGQHQRLATNSLQCPVRKHSKSLGSPRHSSSGSSAGSDDENAADDSDAEAAESDAGGETLVGSVISQLEELARHIRKVSMPPGVSPAPTSNAGLELPQTPATNSPGIVSMDSGMGSVDSRRSSLKTTREFLLHHHPERTNSGIYSSGVGSGVAISPCAGNSFFTQIYRPPATDASSICSTSSSSSEYMPRRQSIRDRVNSSNIEGAMRPPSGRNNVKFTAAGSRRISSSCSKLCAKTGVRFEPVGGRHREADEDEGVDLDDQ
uniref:BTB domain-containing protein n=1 Tax=Globodera rostochiensis TaxID=31243 RepID=A0A914H3G6_GLORO